VGGLSSFDAVLEKYSIDDAALRLLAVVVSRRLVTATTRQRHDRQERKCYAFHEHLGLKIP